MSSILDAKYSSPTNEAFTYSHQITSPASPSTADKSVYLADLRAAVTTLQGQINKDLTSRMEEDKARAGETSGGKAVDDEKEEENYGEEVQGEED